MKHIDFEIIFNDIDDKRTVIQDSIFDYHTIYDYYDLIYPHLAQFNMKSCLLNGEVIQFTHFGDLSMRIYNALQFSLKGA